MNKRKLLIGCGSFVAVVVLLSTLFVFWIFGVFNQEISLRNLYNSQLKVRENTMDNMVKTLKNEYNITDKFAKDFICVVQEQSNGRAGGNGSILSVKSVKESEKLGISSDLYLKMSNTIEGKLSEYLRCQNTLVDIWREHNTFCSKLPYCIFIGNYTQKCPEPIMITSNIVKDSVKSGTLDDNLLK